MIRYAIGAFVGVVVGAVLGAWLALWLILWREPEQEEPPPPDRQAEVNPYVARYSYHRADA